MLFHPLVTLAALAMAASWFMPWVDFVIGPSLAPHDVLFEALKADPTSMPLEVLLFAASFAVAAVLALFSLMGAASRTLAWIAVLIPVGLGLRLALEFRSDALSLGLPLPPAETVADGIANLWDFLQFGAYFYVGGALTLLVLAVIDPGKD